MEELIKVINRKRGICRANIERNKKHFDYPFTKNCDHYYKLILLQKQLECWEEFSMLLDNLKSKRCIDLEYKSDKFVETLKFERNVEPGFVTQKTLTQMIEYIKVLEWRVEKLSGIWKGGNSSSH